MSKRSWIDGAERYWSQVEALYPQYYIALSSGRKLEMEKLRVQIKRALKQGLKRARFKGRLLSSLGDITKRPIVQLRILLEAYDVSRTERDKYNCLLTADSLASFYMKEGLNKQEAAIWIKRAKKLLKQFPDAYIANKMEDLQADLMVAVKD